MRKRIKTNLKSQFMIYKLRKRAHEINLDEDAFLVLIQGIIIIIIILYAFHREVEIELGKNINAAPILFVIICI